MAVVPLRPRRSARFRSRYWLISYAAASGDAPRVRALTFAPCYASHLPLLLLLCTLPAILPAWGANGHRIVAQICYDNLTDQAREKVDAALR